MEERIKLMLGDNMKSLKELPDNSVDSIVTDPPYALTSIKKRFGKEGSAPAQYGSDGAFQRASKGFMGKEWDAEVPTVEFWSEVYRVLKPGGHVLSFGGTRTYHRMAVNIEDAGFEIRDQIMWLYGSGFPKSHNIKKQIEKKYLCQFIENAKNVENKLKLISAELIEERTGSVLGNVAILQEEEKEKKMEIGVEVGLSQMDMSMSVSTEDIEQNTILLLKNKLEENLKKGNKSITLTELKQIIDLKIYNLFQYQNTLKSIETLNGTALKPSNEPICLARKPLSEKSVAENVLKWGTGGLNIDASRIETTDNLNGGGYGGNNVGVATYALTDGRKTLPTNKLGKEDFTQPEGRFPANVILDEEAGKILDQQSGVSKSVGPLEYDFDDAPNQNNQTKLTKNIKSGVHYTDKGGASRFFYVPKVSKKERDRGLTGDVKEQSSIGSTYAGNQTSSKIGGNPDKPTEPKKNNHPTVKPINLLTYLIRLVTPKNGVVMDCFMGSGSTGIAAQLEGFKFIGMEMDEDYFNIAETRINAYEEYRELLK